MSCRHHLIQPGINQLGEIFVHTQKGVCGLATFNVEGYWPSTGIRLVGWSEISKTCPRLYQSIAMRLREVEKKCWRIPELPPNSTPPELDFLRICTAARAGCRKRSNACVLVHSFVRSLHCQSKFATSLCHGSNHCTTPTLPFYECRGPNWLRLS